MKKTVLLITIIGFLLLGCVEQPKVNNLKSISVETSSIEDPILIDDFSISDILVILETQAGSISQISLNDSMVSTDDLNKFSSPGTHDIEVIYGGLKTSFKVTLIDEIYDRLVLKTSDIYNILIEMNLYEENYEDFLLHLGFSDKDNTVLFDLRLFNEKIQYKLSTNNDWLYLYEIFENQKTDISTESNTHLTESNQSNEIHINPIDFYHVFIETDLFVGSYDLFFDFIGFSEDKNLIDIDLRLHEEKVQFKLSSYNEWFDLDYALIDGYEEVEDSDMDEVKFAIIRSGVLFSDTGYVTENIYLPSTMLEEVSVVWESSDENHLRISNRNIGNELVVLRPEFGEDNATVTLTATFTKGDATETREWDLTVIAESESNPYNTIADLHANSELGDVIAISGIVVALYNGGYIITDGEDYLNVYSSNAGLNPGDLVRVIGSYASYHSTKQIGSASTALIDVDQAYDLNPTEITLHDLVDLDAASDPLIPATPYRVKAVIQELTPGNFTNWYLTHGDLMVQIYHASQRNSINYLATYEDQAIELTVFFYTDHATGGIWMMAYEPTMDVEVLDEMPEIDLSKLLEIASDAIDIDDPTMIIQDLDLPLTGLEGSTITWSSSDTDVVANDGTVTRPATDTTVTLTATIMIDEQHVTKAFDLTVKAVDFEPMTIAEALAAEDGDIVYIKGVVNAYREYNNGVFIEDENGDIIYVDSIVAEAGNEIVVIGTRATFDRFGNNRPELTSPVVVSNDEGDNPFTVVTTLTMEEIADGFPLNTGTRYRVEDVVFKGFGTGGGSNEVQFFGNDDVYIFFDARYYGYRDALETLDVDAVIDFIEFTVADLHFGNIRVDGVVLPDDLMPSED